MKRPKHPSGRPYSRIRKVWLPITREPRDEPLTPRLRHPEKADAIGFTVGQLPGDQSDDDEDE